MAILALGKARSRREPNLAVGRLTDLGGMMVCQKGLHESYRMGRCIVMMKLICSLGQRRLTGELLAPQESENSRTHSKFSSDWLPSYIKATRPVLEIFKMAGYFPDSPSIYIYINTHTKPVTSDIREPIPSPKRVNRTHPPVLYSTLNNRWTTNPPTHLTFFPLHRRARPSFRAATSAGSHA